MAQRFEPGDVVMLIGDNNKRMTVVKQYTSPQRQEELLDIVFWAEQRDTLAWGTLPICVVQKVQR